MFGIAGTAELSTFCPGTGTWNRLQDGRWTLASDRFSRNNFCQQTFPCLELCMRVCYVFSDGIVVRPADFTLVLQKCLLATHGAVFPK